MIRKNTQGEMLFVTERLYYDDPYLREFDAVVTRVDAQDGQTRIWLDRSAFYPTSGGQPYDFGSIAGHEILNVSVEDGDVVHTIRGELAEGERVHCSIDAARRRDHMQQHCGEHMLAHTVFARYQGFTPGLHIGEEFSTIDVTLPDGSTHIPEEELVSMEEEINAWIQRDEPVRCWFPDADELPSVPLRKASSVTEHVRIVHIFPDEYCACGGTHPRRTGEVGCIRILEARPSRGKVRISFVCGMRAVRDNRRKTDACLRAAELLSSSWEELPEAVRRLMDKAGALSAQLRSCKREAALARTAELLREAVLTADGRKAVAARLDGLDMETLREAASAIAAQGPVYALLASCPEPGTPALAAFVRGEGCERPMGALLTETTRACGGKGGGRPDFAQGSFTDPDAALRCALSRLTGAE